MALLAHPPYPQFPTQHSVQVWSLNQFHNTVFMQAFLDIFPHAKPTRVGKTLVFSKIPWVYRGIPWVFLKICLSLVKKMSFGAIFLENFHTKLKKLRKNWLLVGKFLSFLTNLLEFSGKIAWVFSGSALSFFRNVQKKACLIPNLKHWRPISSKTCQHQLSWGFISKNSSS